MKILILASQHGDEHLGEKLYAYIQSHHAELLNHIEYLVANPRARAKNVRFIESDMNRSYTGGAGTYEERRASKILRYIEENNFDLVLDMHTATTKQEPCLIMASINPRNLQFIRATSIDKFVIMNSQIVSTALNGVCPQSVSVEVNKNITDELLEDLCADIDRYVHAKAYDEDKYVYDTVELLSADEMSDTEAKKLRNFHKSDLGFYPILVGESSYQKQGYAYRGFKSYKRYKFKV